MIVDKNEESMQDLLSVAVMAKVGDCMKEGIKVWVSETSISVLCV